MDIRPYKRLARKLGVFTVARSVYRAVDPRIRAERQNDIALFSGIVNKGDLVFDIGANMGEKTSVFLNLGARVVAVEPNPNCVAHLKKHVAKQGDLTVVEAGCGSAVGRATLNFSGTDKTASLREDWFALSQSETAVQALDVAVVTLTDLMSEFGVPRYIKIDVEGFESEVLKGLDQPAPLLSFEYHLRELEDLRASMSGLERLGAWHYNCIAMNGRDFSQTDWLTMHDFFELAEGGAIPRKGDVFARPADMSALSRPA